MTTSKKLIPKFSTPTEQTRTIDGQPVTVRRLPAKRAPDVLSRLLSDVGAVVVEMLSSPDQELDPAIEGAIRVMVAKKDADGKDIPKADAGVDLAITVIKAIVFSDALSKIKGFDFGWYVAQMLPGCMSIDGVNIDTMTELDESGIMPRTLFECFQFACEVNFFPTFAGQGTSVGSHDQQPTPTPAGSPIRGKSKLKGATGRDGQQGQTSAATA